MKNKGIQRGQAITFRLPSDTPDHIIKQLQKLKETEKRNFSSKIAEFVLDGVSHSLSKERETVSIPLPKQLNKEQRNWLRHSHSEALIGNIVYQLLQDPVRATSLLASLNSNAMNIDEALYLQEEILEEPQKKNVSDTFEKNVPDTFEDDLLNFDLDSARQNNQDEPNGEADLEEENAEDLLGGFIAQMNK